MDLGRFFARLADLLGLGAGAEAASGFVSGGPRPPSGSAAHAPRPARLAAHAFLLSVDDAGAFLVMLQDELVLGHLEGDADLPFLADVAPRHARLVRSSSFAGGPTWVVEPLGDERVRVGGVELSGPRTLAPGDEVELARNLAFRFTLPDPASETADLELLRGAECGGAAHVLLFAPGLAGRLRIGSGAERHVRPPRPELDLVLVHHDGRIFVRGEGTIAGAEASAAGLSLPCPPPRRFDLSVALDGAGRPPFALALEPVAWLGGPGRPARGSVGGTPAGP